MRRWSFFLLTVASVTALNACSKKRSEGAVTPGSASAIARRTSAPAPAAPAVSAAPRSTLDEAEVRSLISAWLRTQNEGDFAGYQALYAPRFTGIKRSGDQTSSFNREGWLKDRAGMFTRPMRVEMREPSFTVTATGAVVRMEQTWASGDYKDVGEKQLVVIPTSEGARIAREEMLSSRIAASEGRPLLPDVLLLDRGELILRRSPPEDWGTGPLSEKPKLGPYVVRRAVRSEQLPKSMRLWEGRAVKVVDAAGRLCETKIARLELRAEAIPHFGMVESWKADPSARTAQEKLDTIWSLAEANGRWLVGEIDPPCAGLWALDATQAPPAAAPATAPSSELRERALTAFRASPGYRKLEARFRSEQPQAKGRWEEYGEHGLEMSAFYFGSRLAVVSVAAWTENGCNDFSGELSALFGVRAKTNGELELLATPDARNPASVFDLDADGSFEVLFAPEPNSGGAALWRKGATGGALQPLYGVPSFDCPC